MTSVDKPAKPQQGADWTGVEFANRWGSDSAGYRQGNSEAYVRRALGDGSMSLTDLRRAVARAKRQGKAGPRVPSRVRLDNLSTTLRNMAEKGDVILTMRKGRIKKAELFDHTRALSSVLAAQKP